MKIILFTFTFLFFLTSCEKKITYNVVENEKYIEKFEEDFTNQFPKKIECDYYNIRANTNRDRNNVGLLLFAYGVAEKDILEEKNKAKKLAVAKYNSKEKCLLIVNRFETFETNENLKNPEIDSLKIENECEKNLYPIPNFIDYHVQNKVNDLKLDDSFEVYVFEAKQGNNFAEYQLLPCSQMPEKWKNGYSKGIAISESKKIVIYWSVMW